MQIDTIKPYSITSNNSNNLKPQNNFPTFKAGYLGDVFIKGDLPIDKLKKFTLEEYKQLTKSEIASINKMIDDIIKSKKWKDASDMSIFNGHLFMFYKDSWQNFNEYLEDHDVVATDLKKILEKEYGAGNFKVISIGRSVSSICKCLGYKIGEENVIQLPMSDARRFCAPYNLSRLKQGAIDAIIDYLASMGMSKEEIQSSDKKYIFTDYRNFGGTLAGMERLFKSDRMYGDNDNIEFIDILKILPYFGYSWLFHELASMHYKSLSVVDMCTNLYKTVKSVYNPEDWDLLLKSFYFKFMNKEVNKL